MILVIGEILIDMFPEYQRIGGAPFNFAFHLNRFGLPVTFVSRIGNDPLGSKIALMLNANGFDIRNIQIDERHSTGRVMVAPDGEGGHTFEILPEAAYDYIELPGRLSDLIENAPVDLVYFGTLVQRTPSAFLRLQSLLSARTPTTRCFYDINLRPDCFNSEVIRESLKQADILKLNEDELRFLRTMFDSELPRTPFVRWLMKRYGIEVVALTRGALGSEIFTPNAHEKIDMTGSARVADTVGAGDAYSAMLAIGYLKGWAPDAMLATATDFSAAICGIKGAIPEDAAFYEPFQKMLSE